MPGFDRRGPNGEGPMTGRGLGRCAGASVNEQNTNTTNTQEALPEDQRYDAPGIGYGRGLGRGFGRGMGRRFFRRGRGGGFGRGRW